MLLSPLSHGLLALLMTGAYGAPLEDTPFCKKEFWGSPPVLPCGTMLAGFASHTDGQPRYFDEEQLRANGLNWPGVHNNFRTEVVQLPAYWSTGGCNIGFFGNQPTQTLALPSLSSWKNVHTAGVELLNRCIMHGVGGGIHVKSYDGRYTAASIVMWESGSYFDFLSNEIQNAPLRIRPSLTGLLNGTMSMSAINATLGLNNPVAASVHAPWKNFTTTSR